MVLQEIEVPSINFGEKPKKVGKVFAERIFFYFMSVDPNIIINWKIHLSNLFLSPLDH